MFRQKSSQKMIESFNVELREKLEDNLNMLAVYGSFVRGDFREGRSDINVLIILKDSNAAAHNIISDLVASHPSINPFVLGLKGMDRSMNVFTLKFASIRRNYKVLHGSDPFEKRKTNVILDKFVLEQQIRNLRLRLVHAYTTRHKRKAGFASHLKRIVPSLFTDISEVARIEGKAVPGSFKNRIDILEETFHMKFDSLKTLLEKKESDSLGEAESEALYSILIDILNGVILWIETKWELPLPIEVD